MEGFQPVLINRARWGWRSWCLLVGVNHRQDLGEGCGQMGERRRDTSPGRRLPHLCSGEHYLLLANLRWEQRKRASHLHSFLSPFLHTPLTLPTVPSIPVQPLNAFCFCTQDPGDRANFLVLCLGLNSGVCVPFHSQIPQPLSQHHGASPHAGSVNCSIYIFYVVM